MCVCVCLCSLRIRAYTYKSFRGGVVFSLMSRSIMFHWVSTDLSLSGKVFRNLGHSVVTPADMNLYFIDGTDSLCHWSFHWIRGWSFHQPNYWTPYRWLSRRGPTCGTRWTTKREVILPCSRVRGGRTGGHTAVPLNLKTWSLYYKRYKVEIDVLRTSGLVAEELLKVQASPCRAKFNLDCKSAKHVLYPRHNRIAK